MRALLSGLLALYLFGEAAAQDFVSSRATQAVIMDLRSGDLLWSKDADTPVPPASMSKLMTVAVVLDLIKQGTITDDTQFDVSENAWRRGGSKMFVLVDTKIRVRDLLEGAITVSGNDACVVLAENVAGTEEAFARLMNVKAAEWGLTASRFANPTGLPDPEQRMSARDLATLARRLWTEHPEHRAIFSLPEFTWSKITQRNRNPLIGTLEGALGMKTGHTDESGYGVGGLAGRGGEGRVVVLAGLPDEAARRREADRVMSLAFDEYDTRTLLGAGEPVAQAEVFAGRDEAVPLVLAEDVTFTLHERSLDGAKARLSYEGPIGAPVRAGTQVGVLTLVMPGEPDREYPVYTGQTVRGLGAGAKMALGLRRLLTPPDAEVFE